MESRRTPARLRGLLERVAVRPSETNLLIRTSTSSESLLPVVRRVVHEVSPTLAIAENRTMDLIVNQAVWQHRLWSYVLGVFAALALFLTTVGLYSVMSYLVSQSTREVGIRLAIGSTPSQVAGFVLIEGMRLVGAGILIGLVCAAAARRMLAAFVYGVSTTDARTFGAVLTLLLLVSVVACLAPAWRAGHIDPVVALRQD